MEHVNLRHPRTARHNSGPEEVESRLSGRTVESVGRTGKFLHAPLDDGQTMVAHLGMSGRFTINRPRELHSHFEVALNSGAMVRFIDPRTFGFVAVMDEGEVADSGLGRLGPDAWSDPPSTDALADALQDRSAPIKALLLDQRIIAGLGNIYADEILHQARIHPMRPGSGVDSEEITRLLRAIKEVLVCAIDNGGTSLDDLAYLLPDGRAGDNLDRLLVYGRVNLPCFTCGALIERVVVRSRSTSFCPRCQA